VEFLGGWCHVGSGVHWQGVYLELATCCTCVNGQDDNKKHFVGQAVNA